jgi:hypothetical protein
MGTGAARSRQRGWDQTAERVRLRREVEARGLDFLHERFLVRVSRLQSSQPSQ